MVLGFVMARRYVLSKERNEKIQEYLRLKREGQLEQLTEEEKAEYNELIQLLS